MNESPFDNLPPLSQEEALEILSTPIDKIDLVSDYYKAVFHLAKYPGSSTEQALLGLINSTSDELAVSIARRKAIEVLAFLGCKSAIPSIGECLNSIDPYLVESAVWALQKLKCKDSSIHKVMEKLLDDPSQNRRALIKSLSGLGVVSSTNRIKLFLKDQSTPEDIRGASIAAISQLLGDRSYISELDKHLRLPNQIQRYCAIIDVIDAGAVELLPSLISLPLAPSYKIMAINKMWPKDALKNGQLNLFEVIDFILKDNPDELKMLHVQDETASNEFLVKELFCVDFSRCYSALKTLSKREKYRILPSLRNYFNQAKKDYGALYFFICIFRRIGRNSDELNDELEHLCLSALNKGWPAFMKFKPIAIYTLLDLFPDRYLQDIPIWLNPNETKFWLSRYACLLAIKERLIRERSDYISEFVTASKTDPNRFVKEKSLYLEEKYLR